jgi:membrane protease YdiL (CAAX protease family)
MLGLTILTSDQLSWNLNPQTFVGLALISLFLIPLQTTCEEVLFRGYLLQLFGANFKKGWIPLVMTGLVFGLLHGSNPEVAKIGNILMIYYISTEVVPIKFGLTCCANDLIWVPAFTLLLVNSRSKK